MRSPTAWERNCSTREQTLPTRMLRALRQVRWDGREARRRAEGECGVSFRVTNNPGVGRFRSTHGVTHAYSEKESPYTHLWTRVSAVYGDVPAQRKADFDGCNGAEH